MIKSERVDLGLELMALRSRRGARHSCAEIAAWCGCSQERISQLERRALKKLRLALKKAGLGRVELEPMAEVPLAVLREGD